MIIKLSHGAGGSEMQELVKRFIFNRGNWNNSDNDSANLKIGEDELLFTTDSFVVDPIFFNDGNIGHLAFCGTVNDLAVMGAEPLGLSLSFIIEEGFSFSDLDKIINTISELSKSTNIPIVTGDTKVMEKGKIDKIVINTSGVGMAKSILDKKIKIGDKVIISGGIGEHAVAILQERFDYKTELKSDSKPIIKEIRAVKDLVKQAKDPTRGGLAACLNEIAETNDIGILINEDDVPIKAEVRNLSDMLGIDTFNLACEGRFICIAEPNNALEVEKILKKYNPEAKIIGEVTQSDVIIQTMLGKRILPKPQGRIVPRIC